MAEERESTRDPMTEDGAYARAALHAAGLTGLPPGETEYWRQAHIREPYYEDGRHFEDYSAAYEIGWIGYHAYGDEFDFDAADRVMATDWTVRKGVSSLSWEQARAASRAAWQRAHNMREFKTDGSAKREEVIATLSELLDNARDAEAGFLEAVQHTHTASLGTLFGRRAQACRQDAAELQALIERQGEEAEEGGSVSGRAHRVWIHLRGLFGGAGDEAMLAECERAEEAALSRCRKALRQNLPSDIHAIVQRQYEGSQRSLDMITALLARARAQAQAEAEKTQDA
jgi:uncharacterized protein (TIGR02284 family)